MSEVVDGDRLHVAEDELVFNEFVRMATPHLLENGLVAMTFDPHNPYHRLANNFFPVDESPDAPKTVEEGIALMEEFQPNYRKVILEPLLRQRTTLVAARDAYERGENVTVLSDHDSLSDIQKFVASLPIALELADLADYLEVRRNTESFIGRLTAATAVKRADGSLEQTIDLLRRVAALRLFIPDTENIEQSDIPEDAIKRSNIPAVLPLLEERPEGEKGRIIGDAAPASVGKWIDGVRITKPVRKGAAKLVRRLGGIVIPITGTLTGERQYCEIGAPERITDVRRVHELMHWAAEVRTVRTGLPARYDDPRRR